MILLRPAGYGGRVSVSSKPLAVSQKTGFLQLRKSVA